MKVLFVIVLVLVMLLVALPVGMGHMDNCPACTSDKGYLLFGLCAYILSLMALMILLAGGRFRFSTDIPLRFEMAGSIYRPPRLV